MEFGRKAGCHKSLNNINAAITGAYQSAAENSKCRSIFMLLCKERSMIALSPLETAVEMWKWHRRVDHQNVHCKLLLAVTASYC